MQWHFTYITNNQLFESHPFIGYKFKIEAGIVVVEHFRALFHLPDGRVNLRKECVCIFDDGVDVCDDEAVGVRYGLSVDLAASYDEAAGRRFLDKLGMTGRGRLRITRQVLNDSIIRFRQRRYDNDAFRSGEAPGNHDIGTLRQRTANGFECLSSHDDRTAGSCAFEKLQILGDMPQEGIVLTDGVIVRYCYDYAFFHCKMVL